MTKWIATVWTPRGFVTITVVAPTRGRAITAAAAAAGMTRDSVGDIRSAGTVAK